MRLSLSALPIPKELARFKWVYLGVAILAVLLPIVANKGLFTALASIVVVMAVLLFAWAHLNSPDQDQYGLITGGGSCPDNLVVNSHDIVDAAGGRQHLNWPSFDDPAIDREIRKSAAGFIVSPVADEEELGPTKTLLIGRGVQRATALAGHASFQEARRLMAAQRSHIGDALAMRDDSRDPFGAVHILANGFTNSAFFADADIQKVECSRDYHVIFYVEGKAQAGGTFAGELGQAMREGLSKFKGGEKQRLIYVLTDNESLRTQDEMWELPMRVILMITGAFRSSKSTKGSARNDDILHFPRAGKVFAPLKPRKLRLRERAAGSPRVVNDLKSMEWDSMWSKLDRTISWEQRGACALLMAGKRSLCENLYHSLSRELKVQQVRWALTSVPDANFAWICPLVPLTPSELKGTLAGDVFGPLLGATAPFESQATNTVKAP